LAADLLARLRDEPARAAVLLDIDGALAPIVPRPEDARVPDETRTELARLVERYPLVACVTGRMRVDAERILGVEGIPIAGVHGLELEPEAERWRPRLAALAAEVEWPEGDVEDKGLSVTLHYRNAPDEEAARRELESVAARARALGLRPRFGRKVLEVVPPVEASKGTAVRRLLRDRGLRRALYAGDDTTDLDAFAALDELELAIRVAVGSAEGPRALLERADLVVDGPEALLALLRTL
jgi:trehalose 6-phosphate phosphatase